MADGLRSRALLGRHRPVRRFSRDDGRSWTAQGLPPGRVQRDRFECVLRAGRPRGTSLRRAGGRGHALPAGALLPHAGVLFRPPARIRPRANALGANVGDSFYSPPMNQLLETIEIETGPDPAAALIWMHGLGADGNGFAPIVPELGLGNLPAVRFIFPHAPMQPVTLNNGQVMRAWYDVSFGDLEGRSR